MLVYVIVALFIFANVFNVIPLPHSPPRVISFIYPTPINGDLTNRSNFLIVQITLSANETIAENVPVLLSDGMGSMGSALARNITGVGVGFNGANDIGPNGIAVKPIGNPFAGMLLIEAPYNVTLPNLPIMFNGPDLAGPVTGQLISWNTAGDYSGKLILFTNNGTNPRQDYPENRVHVEPRATLDNEIFNRNVQTVEIAGVVVVLYIGIRKAVQLDKKLDKETKGIEKSVRRTEASAQQEYDTATQKPKETVTSQTSTQQKHPKKSKKNHGRSTSVKK